MPMTCILLTEGDRARGTDWRSKLDQLGIELAGETDDPGQAVNLARLVRPALVIIEVRAPLEAVLLATAALCRQRVAPVVLLSDSADPLFHREFARAGGMAHLPSNGSLDALGFAVEIVVARWEDLTTAERKLRRAEDRLKSRIQVERAKGLLMKRHAGMSEEEAYASLRRLSMIRRTPIEKIAASILVAAEAEGAAEAVAAQLEEDRTCPPEQPPVCSCRQA
jgi:two-component system, response regulator PdtaR